MEQRTINLNSYTLVTQIIQIHLHMLMLSTEKGYFNVEPKSEISKGIRKRTWGRKMEDS